MTGEQQRELIDGIMRLEYSYYEPWCKVLQLRDFDEFYLSRPQNEADPDWHEENTIAIHNYREEAHNPVYRDRFMRYFLYRLFVDYTPESMDTEELAEQEWQAVSRTEAESRLDYIISRSAEELKEYASLTPEEFSGEENSMKFKSLKNSFLKVFTNDVIFLVNTDPGDDMPAIIGMDGTTTGIFFLGS